jgi:ribonuclease
MFATATRRSILILASAFAVALPVAARETSPQTVALESLPEAARLTEYTVPTPGARDRGARRIVCGGDRPAAPQACWYTADHYTSFKRIVH